MDAKNRSVNTFTIPFLTVPPYIADADADADAAYDPLNRQAYTDAVFTAFAVVLHFSTQPS